MQYHPSISLSKAEDTEKRNAPPINYGNKANEENRGNAVGNDGDNECDSLKAFVYVYMCI